jgi:hypothetical protein
MDLYAQELKVWKECAGYRESLRGDGDGSGGSGSGIEEVESGLGALGCKMPGGFEW